VRNSEGLDYLLLRVDLENRERFGDRFEDAKLYDYMIFLQKPTKATEATKPPRWINTAYSLQTQDYSFTFKILLVKKKFKLGVHGSLL
jgi:hypothetical protein